MQANEAIGREDLIDELDGENRALRSFLAQYSCDRSVTVGAMLAHMNRSGWRGTAPAFALEVRPETHLTKGGAQIWIRHLIGLEAADPAPVGAQKEQQADVIPPSRAEPAIRLGEGPSILSEHEVGAIMRKWNALSNSRYELCRTVESEVIRRCRVQGGNPSEQTAIREIRATAAQPVADHAQVPAQTGTLDYAKLIADALELAHDLALDQQTEITARYTGYKPEKHAAAARDVALAKEALAAWQARGQQAGGSAKGDGE